ncbi:hypothetical protein JW960_18555 [candidate division KSB1 bacterium]|nr:hypothetical protein [candidate division KSB1 bacterium]
MKFVRLATLGLLVILLFTPFVFGHSMNGGIGLNLVRSAWTLKPGYLTLATKTRFFGKVASPISGVAVTFWDVQGAFSLTYGFNEHFEFALTPIMYQDNHKGDKGYNLPDDIFLGVKAGSYKIKNSPFVYGGLIEARLPTAKYHNISFEPYSAGNLSVSIRGLLTYSKDPLYPEDNVNAHLNLGYINHNDVGKKLQDPKIDNYSVINMTQEFVYGLGVNFPTIDFDFFVELFGSTFIRKPPEQTAFSRENFVYFTPGLSFRANRWLSLNVAADLRVSSDNDETTYDYPGGGPVAPDMANYPAWRINLGAKIVLLPTSVYKISEKDILIKKAESRRELFEQIIREQRETESAEEELERIKAERRKAERELERLRRILEGETKSKKEE